MYVSTIVTRRVDRFYVFVQLMTVGRQKAMTGGDNCGVKTSPLTNRFSHSVKTPTSIPKSPI